MVLLIQICSGNENASCQLDRSRFSNTVIIKWQMVATGASKHSYLEVDRGPALRECVRVKGPWKEKAQSSNPDGWHPFCSFVLDPSITPSLHACPRNIKPLLGKRPISARRVGGDEVSNHASKRIKTSSAMRPLMKKGPLMLPLTEWPLASHSPHLP